MSNVTGFAGTDLVAWLVKRGQELVKLSKRRSEKVKLCAILEGIWQRRPDLRPQPKEAEDTRKPPYLGKRRGTKSKSP